MVMPGFLYQNTSKFMVRFLLLLYKTTVYLQDDLWGLMGCVIRADIR